jgi:hypothetical protein
VGYADERTLKVVVGVAYRAHHRPRRGSIRPLDHDVALLP